MTWSLKIEGGDLVKGRGNSLKTVTSSDKVQQDLRFWILSNLGDDPLIPNYGSVIDFDPETFVTLGSDIIYISSNRLDVIIDEIDRIIETYQKNQFARMQQELLEFDGRHTFASGEIIETYNVEYEQILDTLYVDISLSMLSGEDIEVGFEVKGETS